jgi:stearoyl-CoA desaturase (delta-9 desaturase)
MQNTYRIHWTNALFLTLSPFVAALGAWWWIKTGQANMTTVIFAVIWASLIEVSITAGYHRLFSHRTYEASWPIQLFFLIFGAAALQSSAYLWSLDHRDHHHFVDDNDKDPYSINKGFLWAHIGWLIFKQNNQLAKAVHAPDLTEDKLVQWQHRNWGWLGISFAFAVPALIAASWGDFWGGLFIAGVLRSVVNHHATFLINSLAHCVGDQTYSDSHSARDNWFAAFLTFGEGFHNYHHEFPSDYRNGVRLYDWDPSKWLIYALSLIGQTWHLKRVRNEIIVRKAVQMREKRLNRKLASHYSQPLRKHAERIFKRLRLRVERAARELSHLRNQYAEVKLEHLKEGQILKQIQEASREFDYTVERWNIISRRAYQKATVGRA